MLNLFNKSITNSQSAIKSIYKKHIPSKLRHNIYLFRNRNYFQEHYLIKVYSHPRSGTHFLEAFLAKNFYRRRDLFVRDVTWGHWTNRLKKEDGNEYGLLFGNHNFPGDWINNVKHPMIYIYRDGRDVAYSIWKTPNFIHPKHQNISFSDFLRTKIDWEGTPAKKSLPKENIIQHWERHVTEWHKAEAKNLLIVNYEELKNNPQKIFETILKKFFPLRYLFYKFYLYKPKIDPIKNPVGLKPNKAKSNEWKNVYDHADNKFFLNQLQNKNYLSKNYTLD